MTNIHYPVKNTMGGEFCKKCFNWSNMVGGLEGEECFATKKEAKENVRIYRNRLNNYPQGEALQ